MSKYQVVVGRFEHVDVVGRFKDVPAKIDTGAYRSSIHASDIQIIEKNGKEVLKFSLLGHPVFTKRRTIETRAFNIRKVRNSNGHITTRYEIILKVRLGYKIFRTPFTLIDRANNIFPILIGRKALNKRFLVDPNLAGISRVELKLAAASVPIDEEDLEGVNA
jgi:hypothetical protein